MINICTPAQVNTRKQTYISQAPWCRRMLMPVRSNIWSILSWIMTTTCACSLMRTARHLWRSCYKPKRHVQRRRLNLLPSQCVALSATRNNVLAQLDNKFPISVETWSFITVSTTVRHCVSWTSWCQSTQGNNLYLRFVLIVSSHLCLAFPISLRP
jgi:hypothetical protein